MAWFGFFTLSAAAASMQSEAAFAQFFWQVRSNNCALAELAKKPATPAKVRQRARESDFLFKPFFIKQTFLFYFNRIKIEAQINTIKHVQSFD